jgi:hypothetical protein
MAKKEKPDLPLNSTLQKSFKYYLRNFLWILLLNFVYLTSFYTTFKRYIFVHLMTETLRQYMEPISLGIAIGLLYIIKILVYSTTVDNMFKDIDNTFSLVISQFFGRLFPVFATTLLVVFLTLFMGIASFWGFGFLGVICCVYCLFAPILAAIRTKSTGSISGAKVMMGATAIARSFTLVKGNFIKLTFINILIFTLLLGIIQIPFFSHYPNSNGINIIKFIVFDFLVILNITAMMVIEKNQQIKDDTQDKRFDRDFHFKRS